MFGRIMLFDGRNGSVLSWMPTPDRKEVYYPPQVLWGVDGDQHILFGTGGSSTPGSLWVISLMDLYRKRVDKVGLHLRIMEVESVESFSPRASTSSTFRHVSSVSSGTTKPKHATTTHNSSFGIEQGLLRLLRTQPHSKYQSHVHNSLLRTHHFVLVPKLPLRA